MDKSCNEEKETIFHPKRLKTCEENKDFVSNLPDPILVHILSFLPLRDAIKTALFPRFGKLWLSLPVLDLDNCVYHEYDNEDDFEVCNFDTLMDIIHQISNHNDDNTLDKLRLKLWFPLTYSKADLDHLDADADERGEAEKEKADAYEIEKLLSYAISRKVKVLDLDFMGCGYLPELNEFYELPNVFRSDYLVELRLAVCDIRSCGKISLPALRVLFFNKVLLNDEAMERILHGCPFLEELCLIDCDSLNNLNSENPNLKKLMICLKAESKRIYLSCPHVVSLEVSGWIESVTLLNVSSLVDASICFSNLFRCSLRTYFHVWMLLMKSHKCKTFSLCSWSILVMSIWKLKNIRGPRFEWKHITLEHGLTKWHLPGLSLILEQSSSSLETLTIRTSHLNDSFFLNEAAMWIWEYDFDEDKYWDSQEATFPCMKSIMIYGYINDRFLIQIVKFLLKNAPKLQKMVVSTKKSLEQNDLSSSEHLLEISRELSTIPRASSEAMIYLS